MAAKIIALIFVGVIGGHLALMCFGLVALIIARLYRREQPDRPE